MCAPPGLSRVRPAGETRGGLGFVSERCGRNCDAITADFSGVKQQWLLNGQPRGDLTEQRKLVIKICAKICGVGSTENFV